jgi:hypothetical protein
MLTRRYIPGIFLGALLAVAMFGVGFIFGSLPHSSDSTKPQGSAKLNDPDTQHVEQKNWWNDPIADFTLCLVLIGAFQVGLFYVQLRLIGKSLRDAEIAAEAAKESADAAVISAEHLSRIERAYLFLALEVTSKIIAFDPALSDTRSNIDFGFKNHGKTPASIEELHVMAGFWRESWPAMATADRMPIQKGWMISAGETQSGYSTAFNLRSDEIARAREGKGYILFWGKIIYRDVFNTTRESGWCRAYDFKSKGWRFAGDETLNYYT